MTKIEPTMTEEQPATQTIPEEPAMSEEAAPQPAAPIPGTHDEPAPQDTTPPQDKPEDEAAPQDTTAPALKAARRDAAKYRERAHNAEEHARHLENQLTAARRENLRHSKEFDQIDPAALSDVLDMIDVNACYDENGAPVPDKIATALRGLLEKKPYMARAAYRRSYEPSWRPSTDADMAPRDTSREFMEADLKLLPQPHGATAGDPLQRALSRQR